ncbi:MAG: hypothetical protein FWD51_04770 [Betaproteobacteria bacterium]|nr:hypothetical protein [Betaproteobacteria bacterium]
MSTLQSQASDGTDEAILLMLVRFLLRFISINPFGHVSGAGKARNDLVETGAFGKKLTTCMCGERWLDATTD